MTNAEAREHLKDILADVPNDKCIDWVMALKQAIQVLEQQPSDDCISREEAIRVAEQGQIQGYEWQFKQLCDLPSVTPQQTRWIPVSERLPEEMGTYMTTIDYGKHGLATGQRYYYGQGLWEDDCVTAWIPLPEPYKESEE